MGFFGSLASLFVPDPVNTRAMEFPDLESQIDALWERKLTHAYRLPGVNEALGVPAIFGAVSLIADTVGSLSLEAYRQGALLDQTDTPRLVQRPNPFTTPLDFFRDTAFYLATRGEAWWWVASRDTDGVAQSLYPVPPWEVTVATNDRNRLRPIITWLNREMPNEDMRQITYLPGHDGLRGVGPLQLCGAAVSVAVEASDWAANFFSGSLPSIVGTTDMDLGEDDLKAMDAQWSEKAPGTPRWLTNNLKLSESPFDASKAQLTESRQHQVGEVARMFNMPGALIEYQMGGSSLTYQNQEGIWGDFQRRCLTPHYLDKVEASISDLLTRSTSARFNLKQLLRADPKTRADVYNILVPLGVMSPDEARQAEGYEPGSVDFASVPPQLPAATPDLLPVNRTRSALEEVRCAKGHLTGYAAGYAENKCKCGLMAYGRAAEPAAEPMSVTVNAPPPAPAPNMTIALPDSIKLVQDGPVRHEPVQMVAPESVPQMLDENLVARLEAALAPKQRRIERDANGRMIRIVEDVAS